MHRTTRTIALTAAVVLAAGVLTTSAEASDGHAGLARSSPADGDAKGVVLRRSYRPPNDFGQPGAGYARAGSPAHASSPSAAAIGFAIGLVAGLGLVAVVSMRRSGSGLRNAGALRLREDASR
jgi:hypothetical protein